MKEHILLETDKHRIKVLGVDVVGDATKLKVKINGVDILENITATSIAVTLERDE